MAASLSVLSISLFTSIHNYLHLRQSYKNKQQADSLRYLHIVEQTTIGATFSKHNVTHLVKTLSYTPENPVAR
jgi:hypothetical protein